MHEQQPAAEKLKILIVDDEESIRFTLKQVLGGLGYQAVAAQDGIVAHAIVEAHHIDIAIVDRMLPGGQNGIDVVHMIKEKNPACETIFISAYPTFSSAQELLRYETLAYLTKPFSHSDIISAVKKAEEKISRRSAEGQKIFRTEQQRILGILTGCICHELSTPLQAITGYAELAMARAAQDEYVKPLLANILSSAEKIKLLKKMLAKSCRPQHLSHKSLVQPQRILDETLDFLNKAGLIKYLSVSRDFPSAGPQMLADAATLHILFSNLIINAAQAMEHSAEKRLNLRIEDAAQRDRIAISIEDTGCGIAPESVERVFEPYFTLRSDRGGTGLGLYIVKHLVEVHGGSISVKSRIGAGTMFSLSFPRAAAAAMSAGQNAHAEAQLTGDMFGAQNVRS